MSIEILLNNPHPVYTNLDVISGTVVLSVFRDEYFNAINVKLECESKTRLSAPRPDGRRQDIEFEIHKLLYRTLNVFPTAMHIQAAAATKGAGYHLPYGKHNFRFEFKFPFNNACAQTNTMLLTGQDMNRHVKKTLPPNLSGFPGEANIRYFIKVTAQRTGLLKENYRQELDIKFLPIEPPRPPPNKRESYARRQHQFSPAPHNAKSAGPFHRPSVSSGPPPRISIDGRLPDPPILTANEPVPLRILVKKLNETPEIVFLKNIHIVLVGFTKIRARDLERVEQNTWLVASCANREIPIGNSTTPIDKDVEIDNSFWASRPLSSSIAPTFDTCNLSRWYELRIEVGLGWGTPGNIKPELSVQSLRMPVDVYSGIKPPAMLLAEMEKRPSLSNPQPSSPLSPAPLTSPPSITSPPPNVTPVFLPHMPGPNTAQGPSSAPIQSTTPYDPEGPLEDPPPSYEDAMAEGLPPVDGQRREYSQPDEPATPSASGGPSGTKGERLFGRK